VKFSVTVALFALACAAAAPVKEIRATVADMRLMAIAKPVGTPVAVKSVGLETE
jgi:hypothetical protein